MHKGTRLLTSKQTPERNIEHEHAVRKRQNNVSTQGQINDIARLGTANSIG